MSAVAAAAAAGFRQAVAAGVSALVGRDDGECGGGEREQCGHGEAERAPHLMREREGEREGVVEQREGGGSVRLFPPRTHRQRPANCARKGERGTHKPARASACLTSASKRAAGASQSVAWQVKQTR